ncbi:FecR domain-containing protein [Noviherbaspirillum sp. 17J57-3]|uniref:FecR domain-containing protein n=2 Tax=Noviherbaspirillum galbum TaxID=2709383 RepID=A0A6B3SRB9_9BURK|nr:FecR domain-containing protein [Noviherbaspirillum galbum]
MGGMAALLTDALAAAPQGLHTIKGDVRIDGEPAASGQRLRMGQKIETGPESEAVLVHDSHAFLLRGDSAMRIEQGAGVTVLRYLTGRVLSVFGKGRKRLITPTATIGIRGTACYIEAGEHNTYFCLCYGTAAITPVHAPSKQRTIRTRHHESPLYIGADAQAPYSKAAVDNHRDDELVMLEALAGRVPPFTASGRKGRRERY